MTTQIEAKIEKIYEVIADKTLSAWCKLYWKLWTNGWCKELFPMVKQYWPWCRTITKKWYGWFVMWIDWTDEETPKVNERKIIWHPVMIWDVLDYIEKQELDCNPVYEKNPVRWWPIEIVWNNRQYIIKLREYKRKPIEEQSAETIDFIYSLID